MRGGGESIPTTHSPPPYDFVLVRRIPELFDVGVNGDREVRDVGTPIGRELGAVVLVRPLHHDRERTPTPGLHALDDGDMADRAHCASPTTAAAAMPSAAWMRASVLSPWAAKAARSWEVSAS